MKKFILVVAIAALSVSFASQSQAAPKAGGFSKAAGGKSNAGKPSMTSRSAAKPQNLSRGKPSQARDYHRQHGVRFDGGVLYRGKNHDHWGRIRFDPRYGCNVYWDGGLLRWFYWCQQDVCYYPVSHCPYQCYSCTEVVTQPVVVPECNTCTNGLTGIVMRGSIEPPIHRIPPIRHGPPVRRPQPRR